MTAPSLICDRCARRIPPHAHYVVRIEVFADPAMPAVTSDDLQETDYAARIHALLAQLKNTPAGELQDQVYRNFQFHLCADCQKSYLENPLPPTDEAR